MAKKIADEKTENALKNIRASLRRLEKRVAKTESDHKDLLQALAVDLSFIKSVLIAQGFIRKRDVYDVDLDDFLIEAKPNTAGYKQ